MLCDHVHMTDPSTIELLGRFTILACILFPSLLAFMFMPSFSVVKLLSMPQTSN